ncbi:hypothetical protein NX059_004028 [Plenodomus lindquistii]|nr:hypothetical protein NX059_004028 [Plenodomus lindquistii]
MAFAVPNVTIDDLRAFHATHFPHAALPEQYLHGTEVTASHNEAELAEEYYEVEEDDDLGYYSDGVKRTLTDEQIAMFRHSEIQEILRKRRSQREDGELSEGELIPADPPLDHETPSATCATKPAEDPPPISTESLKQTQSGRVEKPKVQQWATSSEKTRRKNKKNRVNYRAKKKRLELEKHQGSAGEGGNESDEWDPWHQATGPDVQKEEALDLDY